MRPEVAMKYNRRIFPYYKGLGWDPLFYSAIIFLFLTEVKGIAPAKVMYAEAIYSLFLLLLQIPSIIIIEKIGNRKALILGTTFATIQIIMMIFINNFAFLVIAYFMSAFGNAIKDIARNTLLYDATKICNGKNSFANINAKGSSLSNALSAVTSIFAGYLFVINPYIPLILSSFISILAVIMAYRFEEVEIEKMKETTISESIKDIKQCFKFITKSKRLKSLFLFTSIFGGVLMMISTYEKSLLTDLQVAPQYFGIIFATLTLVQAFSVIYQDKIHNTFKNKTLAFISVPIFLSFIIAGMVTNLDLNFAVTLIIVMIVFFIHHFFRGPYWVLEDRYVTNFTNSNIRAKILSVSNLIKNIGEILISFLGGLLLEFYTTATSYLIVGIVGLIIILLVLKYMKKRIGLNPEEYNEKDITFNNLG